MTKEMVVVRYVTPISAAQALRALMREGLTLEEAMRRFAAEQGLDPDLLLREMATTQGSDWRRNGQSVRIRVAAARVSWPSCPLPSADFVPTVAPGQKGGFSLGRDHTIRR